MRVCAAPPFAGDHALSCDAHWQPHDLLRLHRLRQSDGEPVWLHGSFERAPYAVVRRALAADGFVAIGLRGRERSQRYGTWAHRDDIETAVPPEALARRSPLAERNALPAFAALAALQGDTAGALAEFVWGPTGSAGFELATQAPAVTFSSDLDLLIRAPEKLSHGAAIQLLNHLQAIAQRAGIRVDAQLETPAGGVALAEWAADKARVMARHARGPQLVADPWAPAHGDA
ncbi:malonate decarboxylase holo-ACP synthase [Paraburkholderia phytofirmans]|uniref:Phosphoribosyl-dephospho-CoA transferase n=1 Tax=Paraburkholderia phytofirmans OLGA172 TaxID=1417228 RepID=A0A160FVT0_9BURK|nr:malonate decarboxylase holo-ACP synthase [Paraburkholderia phytofirmans]ANB77465.1 phosphoribosyl-dephospho-CoA transferase [Paraburkholderia phytofirmans OLGA172]